MSSREEFLENIVGLLDEVDLPYMISGSLAAAFHGEPRATNDIDLVIAPDAARLTAFVSKLDERFYASPEAAHDALRRRGMFNVIDTTTGWKADLIVRKDRPYSLCEFERRRAVEFLGHRYFLVSPEDSILSKLEWCKLGESERQFRDALQVAAVMGPDLDVAYLRRWAPELGVAALLNRLLADAGEPAG